MKVSSINESTNQNKGSLLIADNNFNAAKNKNFYLNQNRSGVSFKSGSGSNMTKRMWLLFRNLSDYMKEPSEMTNALIAMIGTGAIAPFAIMCSPKKKCNDEKDAKADKDKKFFQAIRQPVSAFLAFAFQVPTTIGIAKGLNYLAYRKQIPLFDDEVLGHLIPDKKFLRKMAINSMDENAKPELKAAWKEQLEIVQDEAAITSELKDKLRKKYKNVDIDISDEELEKLVKNKKRRTKFISEKMADAKHEWLIDKKVNELIGKNFDIKDEDLVTENYQKLAKQRFKEDFANLKKEAKLSWFDKFIDVMGFSNKKLSALNSKIKAKAQEKGLELIRQDIEEGKLPNILQDKNARLRKFVENRIDKAKKLHANKIFWLSLVTNLFMVAFSCIALNWLHPKFADFIDGVKEKRNAQKEANNKKVEVRA